MSGKFVVNERLQFFGRERFKWYFTTIKENCRRAFHAQGMPALAIHKDASLNNFTGLVSPELLQVQSDLGCVFLKDRADIKSLVPGILVFINHVMHFPKLALQGGSLGGMGGG